jgi:hypothetical protein
MTDASQDLGSRIVQAARLAVAMHLAKSCSDTNPTGRTLAIGGAGPRVLKDEQTPALLTGERPRRSTPSPFRSGGPLQLPEAA